MATQKEPLQKRQTNKYVVLCSNTKTQLSPSTDDVTNINKAELRLKLRPSIEMPRTWSWAKEMKNVRPSTMATHFHNYRYGTANIQEHEVMKWARHRRFKSAPEISTFIEPKVSQNAPSRARRFSVDVRSGSKNRRITKTGATKDSNDKPIGDNDEVKEQSTNNEDSLLTNVSEFLAKPNPKKPPDSLRLNRIPKIDEIPSYVKRYTHFTESEEDRNAINPNTAPPLDVFAKQPWYYQDKSAWRYLRVKEPSPLRVDEIFDKN